MKIQIIAHTIPENLNKLMGRWSIIPYYLKKGGNEIDYVLRNEWFSFLFRYKTFKPDIVISAGPIGAMVAFLRRIKIIKKPVVHDWNDDYAELMGNKWGYNLIRGLEIYTIKNSDYIISPAFSRIEQAKKVCNKKKDEVFYIPHGVKRHFLMKCKKRNLPGKNKIKVVYVGSINKQKRADKIIDALKNSDIDLILIGNPELPKEYTKEKNIYFIGEKKSGELPGFLASANCLIVSENNDSALKLMEYLAIGRPILAPKGKISYLTKKYNSIYLYGSFKDLPFLIKKVYNLKTKRNKMLLWEEIGERYNDLLKKLAEKS